MTTLKSAPAQKSCLDCGAGFAWPSWATKRQWLGLRHCDACADEQLRARIKARILIDDRGCWIWQGGLKNGYGVISVRDAPQYVHALAFRLWNGSMPQGTETCHRCDVRRCCNPEHLFAGTHAENVADMIGKGRGSKPPTHVGEANPNATLSDEQVLEIRRLRDAGIPQRTIALQFNVSQSTVWRLAHGITRKIG